MEREKEAERQAGECQLGECPASRGELSEGELLALWRKAQRVVWRLCRRTILRLRWGQGGFYEENDFWQDLFLEFWRVARHWQTQTRLQPGLQEADLWTAWRRALARGGKAILRRAPQRLWHAVEEPLDPEVLACWEVAESVPMAAPLAADFAPARALIQPEDGEATYLRQDALDRLERALWSLPLAQRQLLYLAVVANLPATQVAHCLGLANGNLVYQRLHTTRAALRRRWRGGDK